MRVSVCVCGCAWRGGGHSAGRRLGFEIVRQKNGSPVAKGGLFFSVSPMETLDPPVLHSEWMWD